ncbi:LacI family DNA-binding transcriptional regulator [Clostridium septicum]|uniref:LacI family transcriptional regulator n=1 Tax=Clostridium septicum TaxID=1504 RepID=A0A9N7JJP5_CLOSE|nr:LacI family DNA-binding transcriptional regulator [Clostridium septicum]AYE33595.1 LacI family transcriptional regulator [Clostridium septicum]MDU1312861.1 LacI family DNA-binding transcriptional regulator [Clostridium septicum]QAS61759.1 LacI family transcriptional regulator [Clostridium septicum]UEC21794.1 LacI family transcriptional regulator [Clostridium septicum]USS00154.1 LacI family transcriptional regulator [Clostridium septicum]
MRNVTMSDIAKEANVSKTTVSKVLNNKQISVSNETRKNIFEIAKRLNYVPNSVARSLSTRKTNTIGIILPDIENPFFSEMAKAIEENAESLGYNVILCNSYNKDEKEERYIRLLVSKLVDGVIFASGGNSEDSLNILRSNRVPFVVIDREIETIEKYSGVLCDNEQGIELGVNYLFNKGKRQIAFVAGEPKFQISKIRNESYKNIAKKLGVYNPDIICESEFSIEGGMKATEELLLRSKYIDAIFYSSDVMALGGMKYLIRNGYKIPDDISILGYDNINISSLSEPELTTIAQPIYSMGEEAFKLLIEIIGGSDKNQIIKLKTKLIERDSVK